MIDVFETEILAMVKKSQLKDLKKRKPINPKVLARYLRLLCASSARFYLRSEKYEECIKNNEIEAAEEYLNIMRYEGAVILNRISLNKLNEDQVNEFVDLMLDTYYINKINSLA